ncbi:unnamed protein product, partial [Adineta steineri]
LPPILMIIFSSLTIRNLWYRHTDQIRVRNRDRYLMRMLIAEVIIDIVTSIPYSINLVYGAITYYNVRCRDGSITAAIGAYLGLNKEHIFGSDIYKGQSKYITFIEVDEGQSIINLSDNSIDLITSFVTFHHISQIEKTITELFQILRSGGYLILHEHNCKNNRSLAAKYLSFQKSASIEQGLQ